jgi:hypothetical protein
VNFGRYGVFLKEISYHPTTLDDFDWNILNVKVNDPIDSSKYGTTQTTTLLAVNATIDISAYGESWKKYNLY